MSYDQDKQRISAIQKGKSDDFVFLYDKYFQCIYNHIYHKTFNKELCEDIFSDTFFKAFSMITSFDLEKGGSFRAWLYTIARNTLVDDYKKRHEECLDEMLDYLVQEEKLTTRENNRYLYQVIVQQLDLLGEQKKELVMMRIREGLSYVEISEITQRPVTALRKERSTTIAHIKSSCRDLLSLVIMLLF